MGPNTSDRAGDVQAVLDAVRADGRLEGVVTRFDLRQLADRARTDSGERLESILRRDATVAHPDEPLRVIAHRMAQTGLTHFPVVERGASRQLLGMISLEDLLKARVLNLEAEHRRERIMHVNVGFPFGLGRSRRDVGVGDGGAGAA